MYKLYENQLVLFSLFLFLYKNVEKLIQKVQIKIIIHPIMIN